MENYNLCLPSSSQLGKQEVWIKIHTKENKNKTGNVWWAVGGGGGEGGGGGGGGYRVRVLEMFDMTGESSNIFRGPLCSPLLEYKSSDKLSQTDILVLQS